MTLTPDPDNTGVGRYIRVRATCGSAFSTLLNDSIKEVFIWKRTKEEIIR